MKRNFTKHIISALIIFAFLGIGNIYAQMTHDITASGMSFTPSSITINIGDTIRWTNTSGTHNVNATQATFPSNPESFGNSLGGPGWVFTHVFHTPGVYDYQCDPHASLGMTGMITVNNIADIKDINADNLLKIKIYPQPVSDYLNIEFAEALFADNSDIDIVIYNVIGKEVLKKENIDGADLRIDTQNWDKSLYILQVLNDNRIIETRRILTQ